uniref:Small ribosomal subunit protein uS3 C-terminal domain-containing protein n=1 Tax=Triticum aestivum TaxID=4565 RepID=A0A3B6RJD4_WHEAT
MKKAIELTKKIDIRGVKVKIAGRLGGKEIAHADTIKKGILPFLTIRAKIDYCCYPIRTIYGVLGVKIWIFVDEE